MSPRPMESGQPHIPDPHLYRRGQFISALSRWISLGLGMTALVFVWGSPATRPRAALAVVLAYLMVYAGCRLWLRRHPRSRSAKVVHDVADALGVGLGAGFSGALDSPVWLLLYPHVVAVSVRGGLRYALAMGTLDAIIVLVLTSLTPAQPLGGLHAVAILFCGFMGGTTSSYLHKTQRRLHDANRSLASANELLQQSLGTHESARREQEAALARLSESEERYRHLLEAVRHRSDELESANRRLEELDRLRQQYLRNVSHEFRSPLTVIKGYAEYLMDIAPTGDPSLREVMRVIDESCDRVIDMVDTLLEVSRIEQGAEPALVLEAVDLEQVARASADAVRRAAQGKGVALALEFPPERLRLEADGRLLQHLLRKLLDNAVKYSAAGSAVVVRGRREGDGMLLEVEDAGSGIAPEHLPHIFEKFYMADGGIARRASGAGVGLYFAREIVRLHQGTLEVRSRPGEGTLFSVRLPRASKGARPVPASA